MINNVVMVNDENNSKIKCMDIFEDNPLLHFVKYGKNSKGVSNNTAKRIERVSPFYKFDGKNILYRKNLEQNWRIVPPQNERSDIIWKAHLIGHFQLQSTYVRIKENYYWKNMINKV